MEFTYKGRNAKGELIEGLVESTNKEMAAALLKRDGITVIQIQLKEEKSDSFQAWIKKLNLQKPQIKDLTLFSRQMYSLIRAGVPIIRSIKVVADSTRNEMLETALEDILSGLESGKALSLSMSKHDAVFPGIIHTLVNVGENTGSLDEVFRQIAIHLDREEETRRRIKAATRYPIMVVATIIIAIIVINVVVVPPFKNFFDRFNTDLPLPTRILIFSSDMMVNYWYVMLVAVGLLVFAWLSYIKTEHGKLNWDRWKLKLPLIGGIINRGILARFCRSFALTARTGVPLMDAIGLIAKASNNVFISSRILDMRRLIERGESLGVSADQANMFTPLVLQMIMIGEETGDVDRLLDEAADFYESELDYEVKRLSASIEPIMISVVAVMVLILALGVFLPMWDISKLALGGVGH